MQLNFIKIYRPQNKHLDFQGISYIFRSKNILQLISARAADSYANYFTKKSNQAKRLNLLIENKFKFWHKNLSGMSVLLLLAKMYMLKQENAK